MENLVERLEILSRGPIPGVQSVQQKTMEAGAAEIRRLRAIIRVNSLRWGATDAEIEKMLSGDEQLEKK